MRTTILILTCSTLPVFGRLWYFYHQDPHPEPYKALFKAFAAGMLSILPVLAIHRGLKPLGVSSFISLIIIAPIIEEYCKYLFVRGALHRDPAFDEPIDGVIYATTVALGFAMIENIFYVTSARYDGNLASVSFLRTLITVPGHALFASMRGYARSVQKFGDFLPHKDKTPLHKRLYKIVHTKIGSVFSSFRTFQSFSPSIFPSFLIHGGIWLAIIMHMGLNRAASLGTIATGLMLGAMLILDIFFRRVSKRKLHHLFFLPQDTMIIIDQIQKKPQLTRDPKLYTHPSPYDTAVSTLWQDRQQHFAKQGKQIEDGNIMRLAYDDTTHTFNFAMTTFKTALTYRSLIYNHRELSQYPPNNIYLGTLLETRDQQRLLCKPTATSTSHTSLSYKIPGGLRKFSIIPTEIVWDTIPKLARQEASNDAGLDLSPSTNPIPKLLIHTAWGEYLRIWHYRIDMMAIDLHPTTTTFFCDYTTMCTHLMQQVHAGYKTLGEFLLQKGDKLNNRLTG